MDEDDQALWPAFRFKEIEAVSRALAIADIERRTAAALKGIAIGLRRLHPRGRPAFTARNVRSIRIGVVPVGNLMKNHAVRFPFDSVGGRISDRCRQATRLYREAHLVPINFKLEIIDVNANNSTGARTGKT